MCFILQDTYISGQPPPLSCQLILTDESNASIVTTRNCLQERSINFTNVTAGRNYTYIVNITNIVGPSSRVGYEGMHENVHFYIHMYIEEYIILESVLPGIISYCITV